MLQSVLDDLRYAARLLRKNAALSAATVLMFTIGIGLDAGVFTIIDGLLLRPRVAHEPASFVDLHIEVADAGGRRAGGPYNPPFAGVAAGNLGKLAAHLSP